MHILKLNNHLTPQQQEDFAYFFGKDTNSMHAIFVL